MFNIVYNYLCFKTSNSIGNACTTGTGHLNYQALASVPAPYCYQKNKINLLLSFMPGVFDISSDEGASETGSVSEPAKPVRCLVATEIQGRWGKRMKKELPGARP